jgi:hypothetical protein
MYQHCVTVIKGYLLCFYYSIQQWRLWSMLVTCEITCASLRHPARSLFYNSETPNGKIRIYMLVSMKRCGPTRQRSSANSTSEFRFRIPAWRVCDGLLTLLQIQNSSMASWWWIESYVLLNFFQVSFFKILSCV